MPDNAVYYHVAYSIGLVIYSLYALSLYSRRRKLRK